MDEKLFKMDEILFKWMKIVKLDEFIHYNLAPTVFGVFGISEFLSKFNKFLSSSLNYFNTL
jgi:hypothetical protein